MIAVFARDITMEKKQEMQLKQNEQKYRTIFENSPEGIVLLDTKGNFLDINGRLFDWMGYQPEEVIGHHITDQPFFSSETKKLLLKKFRERLEKKNILPYEIEVIAQDGHVVIGLVHGSLLYDEKGNIVGDLVMISDISQRKALEKKIFEQEKMAALGRIASVVSHELNTPLTNISLAVEMLSSNILPKHKEDINTIKSEVEHASDIITRVLDFSRTDDLQYSTMDLGEIIQEAIKILQKQTDTQNVTINIPKSLSLPMQGDKNRFREVFINLLKNALEAADPQKKNHIISINGHIADSTVIVTLEDTGIGIKKESLKKITDAFFTTKPLAEGTGLGLTISRWIIRQHGGTLQINSVPKKGTTVTITLPSKN
jgi:two-component system, sporulation sensor kinase E